MSNIIRKMKRNANSQENDRCIEVAMELAIKAGQVHEEAVQFARDILNNAIQDGEKDVRKKLQVITREFQNKNGQRSVVLIAATFDDQAPTIACPICVDTEQQAFTATDDATNTLVSFTTTVRTMITEDQSEEDFENDIEWKFDTPIWEKTTHMVV